jgi:hypothetical protein
MKISTSTACITVALFIASFDRVIAQSEGGDVQVAGGISTASFTTPEGKIQVHVASDAAPGDTISGVVLAEPSGQTPQEQQANLGTLSGLVVELEGQPSKVASKQYEWTVPVALRIGRATLRLKHPDGRVVSQVPVPIDPQPPLPRGTDQIDVALPSDLQLGRPVTIRGRFNGLLRGKAVDVGGSPAELLAASPRQVVFRTTQPTFGDVPIRFTDDGLITSGVTRVMGVRLTATSTQLLKGQRATLTTTVTGLGGISEPVTLTFKNLSPATVQIEGGSPRITIQRRDVTGDGTYTDTRRLTGIQAGGFQIVASVSRPALSRFNVSTTMKTVVDAWEVRARFRIAPDAFSAIQRSIMEARRPLDDFLRQQELNGADPQSVFQALLSHYCYDLRDNRLSSVRPTAELITPHPVMLAFSRQPATPTEVTASEVRQWSFTQFLSDLIARATSQSIGYLFVTSTPERAGITIDGQRKSELTNRRFVTTVGTHEVHVARLSKPCRVNIAISQLQTSVVTCE